MTPAQPEPQVGHRTRAWCAATRGARDADRDQSRASRMPGKCGPRTGDDPRDPHRPGALTACHRVLWHTRKERRTTGPVGYGPAQRDFRAAWEELLRNHKMRSYKKKTVKKQNSYDQARLREHHDHAHRPEPNELQGAVTAWPSPMHMASTFRR